MMQKGTMESQLLEMRCSLFQEAIGRCYQQMVQEYHLNLASTITMFRSATATKTTNRVQWCNR